MQHEHVERHQEGQWDARGLLPRQRRWHSDGLELLHQRVFRKCAGAPAHDAVAHRECRNAVADGNDFTGALCPNGLPCAGLAVQAMAHDEFPAIQRGSAHAHQELTQCRPGDGSVPQIDHGIRVGHLHPVGLHFGF